MLVQESVHGLTFDGFPRIVKSRFWLWFLATRREAATHPRREHSWRAWRCEVDAEARGQINQ
jgi:hypothetical protein